MRQLLATLILIATCAPWLSAQENAPADVGLGAPRSTLGYFIGQPKGLATMLGFTGQSFFWEKDIDEELSYYQERKNKLSTLLETTKAKLQANREALSEADRNRLQENILFYAQQISRADSKTANRQALQQVIDVMRAPIQSASRLDCCLVDITSGGPKVYLDFTLADGSTVDLSKLEGIEGLSDLNLNGLATKRYISEMLPAPLTIFQHQGHFYVALYADVADDLAEGLTNPRLDGESLAESSRFKKWYLNPRTHQSELWLNAHQIRRAIESTEGLLPSGFDQLAKDLSSELGLRHWELFVLGIDHDPQEAKFSVDLKITSRRDNKTFTAIANPKRDLTLSTMMPKGAAMYGTGNLASPLSLWENYRPILQKTLDAMDRERARSQQRKEEEAKKAPEERKEDAPKGEEPVEERHAGELEIPPSSYERVLADLEKLTSPSGKSFTEALGLITGHFAFATQTPIISKDKSVARRELTSIVILCENGIESEEALSALVKSYIKEERRGVELRVKGAKRCYYIDGAWMRVIDNLLCIAACENNAEATYNALEALVANVRKANASTGEVGPVAEFSIDMKAMLKAQESELRFEERTLDRRHAIRAPQDLDALFPKGLHLKVSLRSKSRMLRLRAEFQGLFTDQRILDYLFKPADFRPYYIDDALSSVYQAMSAREEEGRPLPLDAKDLISDTVHIAMLQNPYDSRFKGHLKMGYFPSLNQEFEEQELRDQVAIIKANAEAGFVSYRLADFKGRSLSNMGGRIVLYQNAPDTFGGRVVLYGSGYIGWLHESVWPQALALMKAGKQIPDSYGEYNEDDNSTGSNSEGNKRVIDAKDTRNKAALNVVKLYADGVQLAPATFTLHSHVAEGQSATFTTTRPGTEEKSSANYRIVKYNKEHAHAVVEIDYDKGYVIALLVSTKDKRNGDAIVRKAWVGLKGLNPSSASVAPLPAEVGAKKPDQTKTYDVTTEKFEGLEFGGTSFNGTKTIYRNKGKDDVISTIWTSDQGYFTGLLKTQSKWQTIALSATSTNAKPTLLYPENVTKWTPPPSDKKAD